VRERRGDFAQKRAQTLLEVRLRLRVSVDMARTRHTQASAEPPQIDPTQLTADRPRQALRHPGGDGAPVPAVVLRSWSIQRCSQLLVVRHRQELSMWPRETPLVFDALRPERMVAAHNLADPVHTESCAVPRFWVRFTVKEQQPGLATLAGEPENP
jgi:hypothetical protein